MISFLTKKSKKRAIHKCQQVSEGESFLYRLFQLRISHEAAVGFLKKRIRLEKTCVFPGVSGFSILVPLCVSLSSGGMPIAGSDGSDSLIFCLKEA